MKCVHFLLFFWGGLQYIGRPLKKNCCTTLLPVRYPVLFIHSWLKQKKELTSPRSVTMCSLAPSGQEYELHSVKKTDGLQIFLSVIQNIGLTRPLLRRCSDTGGLQSAASDGSSKCLARDPEWDGQDQPVPGGRSISLVDLQEASPQEEAPPRLRREGLQTAAGPAQSPLGHAHSQPVTPQPRAALRDGQPQSEPQARRRPLQPLCFQNPVYHLSNVARRLSAPSSSDNVSTASSRCSGQPGVRGRVPSGGDSGSSSGPEEGSEPPAAARRPPLVCELPPGTATAVALPRQSSTAGTAHIVKVDRQARGGAGARAQHSLRSSSSADTDTLPPPGPRPHLEEVSPPLRCPGPQPPPQVP